jgi:hypothetical protein
MDAYRIEGCIALTPPAANARELRVSMVAAGAEPVELFKTGSGPTPSRFDAWLDKYWVPLFSSSARPTTAAL